MARYCEDKADLAREQPGLTGRGWPKPGAALGVNLPLRVPPVEADLAELSAGLFST